MQNRLREHFKKEFEKSGKSQKGCSEFAQISEAKLSLSLNGKREFRLEEIGPIASFLECGLPQELLVELNAAASLKVPVIGAIEPGITQPFVTGGRFEEVYIPYVPSQDIANLEQYAQRLVLDDKEIIFSGKYYMSCVDYQEARHGFFDNGDVVIGLRKKQNGYEKNVWKINIVSQKAYAVQMFTDKSEMVKLSPYAKAEKGELEIIDLILAIFVTVK